MKKLLMLIGLDEKAARNKEYNFKNGQIVKSIGTQGLFCRRMHMTS